MKQPNQIDALEADYLYTATSQIPGSGDGLFAAIPIYKDEIIALFKGELLTEKEAAHRAKLGNDAYFVSMLNGSIMDSMYTDCFAKYANDAKGSSTSSFTNNAKITLDEQDRVCLIASRKIKEGEEIFCGYGAKYWKRKTLQASLIS